MAIVLSKTKMIAILKFNQQDDGDRTEPDLGKDSGVQRRFRRKIGKFGKKCCRFSQGIKESHTLILDGLPLFF